MRKSAPAGSARQWRHQHRCRLQIFRAAGRRQPAAAALERRYCRRVLLLIGQLLGWGWEGEGCWLPRWWFLETGARR